MQAMVTGMLHYMEEISDCTYTILHQLFQPTFQSLITQIEVDLTRENETDGSKHP